ncbi:MAG: mechanosensitive ion channel [Spirochaetales bacterium]|nr:mechanosensitive ion channel [Candidatus Physcosoma equi]
MTEFFATIQNWVMTTGIRVVISAICLIIAFRIIKTVSNRVEKKLLEKFDETLTRALCYGGRLMAKIVVITCLISYLGIDTTGMAAVIGSLGVCVGLAVNGALSNLAGGILLLITRPFKIGDYISAQGTEGIVEDIRVINTKIVTLDNKVVYLPNGALSSGNIMNFSEKELRRVDYESLLAATIQRRSRSSSSMSAQRTLSSSRIQLLSSTLSPMAPARVSRLS